MKKNSQRSQSNEIVRLPLSRWCSFTNVMLCSCAYLIYAVPNSIFRHVCHFAPVQISMRVLCATHCLCISVHSSLSLFPITVKCL
uniref:Uncharacterized protein n=1 Tax=Anguilla anguilla TaxID=7936 RepID=A0A0E9SHJ2_ANGAN